MAMACKQHHLLLGLGGKRSAFRQDLKPSFLPFIDTHIQRLSRPSRLTVSVAPAGSLSSENSGSKKIEQTTPTQRRRRGQLPPEWEALSKPVPRPPNYLLLAFGFSIVYLTRQAVAAELIQWASLVAIIVLTIIRFTQRLFFALLLRAIQLVKIPIASVLTLVGWSGLFASDTYRLVVNTTSIWPTTKSLLLVTLVFSVGEATRATAVSGQPWCFLLASAFGVGAVWGVIHHSIFVLLLLLLTGFSLVVQKKDTITAAVPAIAVLVAIAEPPLKAMALASYLAGAIYTHWRTPIQELVSPIGRTHMVQPLVMVVAAFFVGLTAGSRYLRAWQILWLAK